MSAQKGVTGGEIVCANGLWVWYLLVEERFAHGPGNGAGLRAGDGGFGHGGRSATDRVSSCVSLVAVAAPPLTFRTQLGSISDQSSCEELRGRLGDVKLHENQPAKCQPVPKAVRELSLDWDEVAAEFQKFWRSAGKSRGGASH